MNKGITDGKSHMLSLAKLFNFLSLTYLKNNGFTKQEVLITGCTSGLGYEISKALLAEGASVIGIGRNSKKLNEMEKVSAQFKGVVCDISDQRSIDESLAKVGDIDVLINNAGIIAYQPLEKHAVGNIADIINTNVLGTILVTAKFVESFKQRNSGTIVNISSTSGLSTGGHADESVYMASKYAVRGFTEGLKKEFNEVKSAVRVLGFYPGGMQTELFARSGMEKDTSGFMDPAEVAKVIVFMIKTPDSIKIDHIVLNRNKFL